MEEYETYRIATTTAHDTKRVAASLATLLEPGDVCVLSGDLGAGKTQFVQGVAEGMGITEPVTSPTFNILLQYRSPQATLLEHFDWYRLDDVGELEDVGYYDVLEEGIVFIEWGEKFPEAVPDDHLAVFLAVGVGDERVITFRGTGSRSAQVAEAWGVRIGAKQGETA